MNNRFTALAIAGAMLTPVANADLTVGDTTLKIGGYIKVNGQFSKYSNASTGNEDFLQFSTIGTGTGDSAASDTRFHSDAKTSRIFFKTMSDTDAGQIDTHIELDFVTGTEGNEVVSNSYKPRLRHAYLKWGYNDAGSSLLIGQTWGTFFNVGALPEAVDFIGPTAGTLFNRQVQLRWTQKMANGSLMLSLENPSTNVAITDGSITADDSVMPDIVARYNGIFNSLNYTVSLIARDLAVNNGSVDDSETGFGFNVSGKWSGLYNGANLKFSFSGGDIGRYIALNTFRDGAIVGDALQVNNVMGGYISWQQPFSNKLRANIMYASSWLDAGPSATDSIWNIEVNLMYSPTKKLTFGGAYIYAEKEMTDNTEGDLSRFQLTAKYVF